MEPGEKGYRKKSLAHTRLVRTCACGRKCKGNGGWSKHTAACSVYKARQALWRQGKTN